MSLKLTYRGPTILYIWISKKKLVFSTMHKIPGISTTLYEIVALFITEVVNAKYCTSLIKTKIASINTPPSGEYYNIWSFLYGRQYLNKSKKFASITFSFSFQIGTNFLHYLEGVKQKQPFVLAIGSSRVSPEQTYIIIQREAIPQE